MNQKNETTTLATAEPTGLAETATAHAKAMAEADVQAKHVIARRFPRDLDTVREDLIRDCKRPMFAEAARYLMPIGDGVVGWTIRFVEAALGHMGNVDSVVHTIFSDAEKEILSIRVTDYQKNVSHATTATVSRTVERKYLKKGQKPISTRRNSYGDIVHTIEASESDFRAKRNAEVSKHVRTNGERLLPPWLKEECLKQVLETQADSDAEDPDAARRTLADAFAELGVKVADLKLYLGHDLDQASPVDLAHLRAVFATVREGQYTWKACLASRLGDDAPSEGGEDKHASLKADLKKKLGGKSKGGRKKPTGKAAKSAPASQSDKGNQSPPSSGAGSTGSEPSEKAAAGDASAQLTDEERAQGFEIDPTTGEVIPPAGSAG